MSSRLKNNTRESIALGGLEDCVCIYNMYNVVLNLTRLGEHTAYWEWVEGISDLTQFSILRTVI